MNETMFEASTQIVWLPVVADAAKALLALGAAWIIASGVRVNRGARVNRAWAVIAIGLLVTGLALSSRTVARFGLPNFGQWDDAIVIIGLTLVLSGLLDWRRTLSQLAK